MTDLDTVPLTDRDRAILDFERSWWTRGGVKETAIGEELELSASRYYALLAEIMDMPAAMDHDPLLVRRLRRLRDARRRSRAAGAEAARDADAGGRP
ncbi:DUF3263 domain-containing protein [Iamia majanohamensis]|uniref:DUF3263 domain-containing protein n=1 Tax=Iamia majanohamensis TaxID=467976 RepID=A0AAE9Y6F7_9ACTN|nr:DUF3263 domain-containing protein [Iamia majanohamensis]WCO67790.1 DUF3263 domain-containing protein [Iamia majanohamensis]